MTTNDAMPADPARLTEDLNGHYPITTQQIEHFRDRGFIKLKQVLAPETLRYYGDEITRQVFRLNNLSKPMEERTTYEKAFLQIMNLWTKSEVVREFSFSRKLARIATELMGVRGVRMYHDQALYKEAGGGITPWHADQFYWPVSNSNTCTVWVPLQATPPDMGPLAFSATSHRYNVGRELEISDESEKKISKQLLEKGLPLEESPFELGEVSYHLGWTFHRAGPNTGAQPRKVMTVIYVEDGIKLVEPRNKAQQNDWNTWMPGASVGQPIQTELNPLLYHTSMRNEPG